MLLTKKLTDMGPLAGRHAMELALFLDVDGTLLEIASTPDAVVVDPATPALLTQLHAITGGAVALISGRSIADLDRLFPGLALPSAGQHGAELREVDAHNALTGDEEPWRILRTQALKVQRAHPRLLVEDKGRSIAIHYRRHPELAALARRLALYLAGQGKGKFVVQQGHCVEEIKSADVNKGRAIARMMERPPFQGRLPIFIGDDVTDEDAFCVVNQLGGLSIKVGFGPTAAPWRLRDPSAVHDWLKLLHASFDANRTV